MQSALIANLSGKKFTLLMIVSIFAQIICFLIGGLVAPRHGSSQNIIATACRDYGDKNGSSNNGRGFERWYYTKGKGGCEIVDMYMYDNDFQNRVYEVVYTMQISPMKNKNTMDYTKWQNLIAILHIDIEHQSQSKIAPRSKIMLDTRLAYRNLGDPIDAWKPYTESKIGKIIECSICNEKKNYSYDCIPIPLFELGPLHHDYYLLNIRFPLSDTNGDINKVVGYMSDLWLTAINENGNFTKLLISLKVIFFDIVIGFLIWYWRRVQLFSKSPTLVQCILLALASALSFLNMPMEYLTLYWDIPVMSFLNDIRQAVFYAVLLSFLLIFVGEHLTISDYDPRNSLKFYWRQLCAVCVGCLTLFLFNSFARVLAVVYLSFLTYMVWKIFIKVKIQMTVLPSMSSIRGMEYDGVIYRFKLLMVASLLCASLTVIGFIFGEMAKGQWKWDEDYELNTTLAFFIGVYGMWNIYTIALLYLYAPSAKKMTY